MKNRFWVFNLQSQFSWGKYKGKNCQWIVDNDSDYIVWLAKNMREYSLRMKKPFIKYFEENYFLWYSEYGVEGEIHYSDRIEPFWKFEWSVISLFLD